jgi:pimeloyl-ACP methyl ester carboxylesterase
LSPLARISMFIRTLAWIVLTIIILGFSEAYAPVVICPGFGNDSIDYDTPLDQPSSVGLISVLSRRGFDKDKIYTVPVERTDWARVALGLFDIPRFYTNDCLPSGFGYGWYLQRLKDEVDRAYEESGGQKVILLAHSAGGWLARAAMADGIWCSEREIKTSERIRCLTTLGAIHRLPSVDPTSCVTRGALKNTDALYPGALLRDEGIAYVTIGGSAVVGDDAEPNDIKLSEADELYSKRGEGSAARVAYTSYKAVSGIGNTIGDGVVPLDWAHLEGAKQITLDGVVHSINEAGTTIPSNRWYGSEDVIDRWLPILLEEAGLVKGSKGPSSSFSIANIFSSLGLQKNEIDGSR